MLNLSRVVTVFLFFVLIGTAEIFSTNFISAAEKIDINTVPLEDLVKIIHIGEARALELISLRPFSSLDDLTKIKGIAELRIEDIKKQGLAWISIVESQQEPQIEAEEELTETKPQLEEPKQKLIIYPSGVVLNEILPSPEGPDTDEEWIETSNQNGFEVSLSGWQIADTVGKTNIYTFPEGSAIGPKGFLVLSRPLTKITLNNSGDSLKLIQPDGNITDFIEYQKAPRGESYNRIDSQWSWSPTLTPGSENIILSLIAELKPETEKSEIGDPKVEPSDSQSKKGLAAISKQVPEGDSSSLFILLIALAIAIFSGIIILILKKKIKIRYNKNV